MQTLTIAFAAIAVLAGLTALARRASPPGRRRDALSVTLVVLALVGAFVLCFVLGSLVRGARSPATPHAGRATDRTVSTAATIAVVARDRRDG